MAFVGRLCCKGFSKKRQKQAKTHPAVDTRQAGDGALREVLPVYFDRRLVEDFARLDQNGKVKAEYVYLEEGYMDSAGQGFDFKTKSMTLSSAPASVAGVPLWSYSNFESEDVILVPRKLYRDPFRRGDNILVWADSFHRPEVGSKDAYGQPVGFNTRPACDEAMRLAVDRGEEPWFGLEQEYYLLDVSTDRPLGWPEDYSSMDLTAFHGATGATKAPGRELVEAHYQACLYAGVQIGGVNAEDAPGQWEYQVGPGLGIGAADDLWMSRFILQRLCELFKVKVSFDPKPVPGFPGLGGHTNFSTTSTRRAPGGFDEMKRHFNRLREQHDCHMHNYGPGNMRRLTGEWDTKSMRDFDWDIDSRDASIRVTATCVNKDCGYYEDRRPAANMDPFVVTRLLVETTLLGDQKGCSNEVMPIQLTQASIG